MNDWKEVRIKDMAKIGSGSTPKSSNPLYYDNGILPWLNTSDVQDCIIKEPHFFITPRAVEECNGLSEYPKGTLLFAMYGGGTIGNVGYMSFPARINQACCAMVFKKPYDAKFLFYAFQTNKSKFISYGFGGSQVNLSQGQIARFSFKIPSLSVQHHIVSYLDDKTAKINKAVSLLQKKRDAYTRLKSSIINRAVTRGFNPNVKLKDSGVEWIGMIPENWEVKRIKEIGNLQLGKMLTEKPKEGYKLHPYLKSKNIGYLELNLSSVEEMYFSDSEFKLLQLHKNDLVFSEGGEVGKTAIWQGKVSNCCIQNSVQKLTVNKNCDARYYLYLSYMLGKMGYYKSIVNLVSIMHLTYEKLRRVKILVPPKEEQQAIANYLDTHCARIDHAISIVDKQIDAYTRLKKSLINEVVTGKRKV